jgi:ribonucleoside-diphosphate reductase alpha subunit
MNNKQSDNSMKRITEAKHVTKRDGKFEKIELSKIEQRLAYLCTDEEKEQISICSIAVDTSQSIYDKISTIELDNVSAQICASRASKHPLYETLGGRILSTNLHKETLNTFSDKIKFIHSQDKTFLRLQFVKFIKNNANILDTYMDYSRDLTFGYFAFMTLQKSYLIKIHNKIVERPQDIYMRVAVAIHCEDTIPIEEVLSNIKNTYDYMSLGYFTHATPTLFNAGLRSGNLASCFLLGTDDSITGQFKTLGDCAQISKWAGGIGLHVSNVRGKNSQINSTKGSTHGIVPMLKVFNETARYVNQSGRRNGSIAVYLEPWHSDILEFLDLRKPTGAEELRARDLFLALWIPDRFMVAVENKENWYLMSPDESPGLQDVYGEEFNKLYQSYIDQKKYREMIPAELIWKKILESQFETGVPYIGFKDSANKFSNQKNIGTIKSSNLCIEIMEASDHKRYSVCNLASIAVNKFVENTTYNYSKLHNIVKQIVYNINRVIEITYYPTLECKHTNLSDRPMGIGIQGVADLFHMLKLSYASSEAIEIEQNIMETIYHASIEASCELAIKYGKYQYFDGSDLSKGIFHFQHYNTKPRIYSDWDQLKEKVIAHGVRNSLMIALMPTASTSQILGNNECFEPMTSNIYTRRTSAGEFIIVNKHLIKELSESNLWTEEMREQLIINDGSIQTIKGIPDDMKERYKTVWEIKMKDLINHAIARQAYVDQAQSMNLFMPINDANKLTSALLYGWKNGLKTGMYYLRTLPASAAQKFSIDANKLNSLTPKPELNESESKPKPKIKVFEADDVCVNCSS